MKIEVTKTSCPRDCYSGCTLNVYTRNGRIVGVEGDESNNATKGKICVKGKSYTDYVYSPNRVAYPLIRKGKRGEGNFERISWEDAVSIIGDKLQQIKHESSPLSVLFYPSGGCLGLLSEYYNGFFGQYGGYTATKGNLCYSAGIEATKLTYGEVLHNAPWDLENAGLIILWGKNPAHTNVHEMGFINNAVSKGSKLVTIDPIKNSSSSKSCIHISPEPGTDSLLASCVINLLIQRGSIEYDFINKHTLGFELLKDHVLSATPEKASSICKINIGEIYELVELIEKNKPMTLICGYGIQRYKNGGQTVRSLSMIPALRGDIGIKGGGFRFANKQWKKLKWPFIPQKDFEIRSTYPASTLSDAIECHKDPDIRMLWIERGNPLTMAPDTNRLKKSFEKLDFIVVIDQFMTDTAVYADIILPAQSFFEYNDIFAGYWSPYLSCCKKVIEPLHESKNESQIYRMLGKYLGYNMDYLPQYDQNAIEEILKHSGIDTTVEELKEGPVMSRDGEIAFKEREFRTPSGKIELYSETMEKVWGLSPLPDFHVNQNRGCTDLAYPLRFLSTHARERLHSQFADIERLKVDGGAAYLHISHKDAQDRNINNGDSVIAYNERGEIHAFACITGLIKEGVVNVYEGLPDKSGANVNNLTCQDSSDIGYGATYYDTFVQVKKAKD